MVEKLEERLLMTVAPTARADSLYSTPVSTALVVGANSHPLLENDFSPQGYSLTASVVTNPAHGTISNFGSSTGQFTYTPTTGYSGLDSFTYKINDGSLDSVAATVSIAVGGNFGPRINEAEMSRGGAMLTGGLVVSQQLTPASGRQATGSELDWAGLGLTYRSDVAVPKPIVVLETFLQSNSSVPDEIQAQLTFNGSAGTSYSYSTSGLSAGQQLRFALQADATGLSTGRYAYTVTLKARFGSTWVNRDYTGYSEVVNRGSSTYEFGRGWQLNGLDKLVSATGGMMLAQSGGDALWFADDGSGGYLRAAGDQTFSTLVQNPNQTYTLTDKHGNQQNFSSAGLLSSRVDRNGNTTSFTYTSNLLTQISDPLGRNTTLTYTSGRLTSVTDFASRAASLSYDGSGRLSAVTEPDPDGAAALSAPVTSFSYDATTHQLTQVTDPLSHNTSFSYGSHGRLTSTTHPDSSSIQLTSLQTIGLPTASSGNSLTAANPTGTITNERSKSSTFRTDRFGNLTEITDPLSNKTTIEVTIDGLPTKITLADPDGAGALTSPITKLGYSTLGNLEYQLNPDSSRKTWTYNSTFNVPTATLDEIDRTQSFSLDSYGNVTAITDAAGYVTSIAYNSRGLPTSITQPDPDGAGAQSAPVTSFSYDSNYRLTTLTNPDSTTRTFAYDSADNLTSDTDELSHSATYSYDLLGRLTSRTDRTSATTSVTYNALGLVTKQTDALGQETDYSYNNRNWVTTVTLPDPDGAGGLGRPASTYSYDATGNVTQEGVPSITGGGTIDHTYDDAGRRTETSRAGDDTSFSYDNLGRLLQVTDPLYHLTKYEYNSRSWQTKVTLHDPDGAGPAVGPSTQFAYNTAGQRTSVTDANGYVTQTTYDPRGMVQSIIQPDPDSSGPLWSPSVDYIYDNAGRMTATSDQLCRQTDYAYNSRGLVTSITAPDPDGAGGASRSVTSASYDSAGRVTSVTDPLSHVTTIAYDNEGRITSVTLADPDGAGALTSPVYSTAYDSIGQVTSTTDPQGFATSYGYDHLGRQTSMTRPDPDGGGPLSAPVTSYTYNAQGLLSQLTDPLSRDTTFQYDSLGRRTGVTDESGHQTQFAYTDNDLLSTVTLPDPDGAGALTSPVTTYGYDVYNHLTSISNALSGQTDFTYDPAGQLLTVVDPVGNTTSYAYDAIGRQTIETNEVDKSRSYIYDAAGNVVRKTDRNGRVIQYIYDQMNRVTDEKWLENATPAPSLSVATTTQGGAVSEVQRVGFSSPGMIMGGTFTLSFNGYTTSAIAFNASAATVQSALEALTSIGSGNVAVSKLSGTGTRQEWQLTFQGSLAGSNVAQTTVNSANITAMGGLSNIQATDTAGGTNSEVQTVTLSNASGGTFRLAFTGQTTAPIAYNASSADVDSALESLNSVDQVTVSGSAGGPWTVTFAGSHSGLNVAQMNGDAATLTNGTVVRTITSTYDAADQLTAITDPDSTYAYTYDNIGRLLTVDNNGTSGVPRVILTSAFDASSNRTSLSASVAGTADFLNSYTYDHLNRLTQVTQAGQNGGNTVAEKRVDMAYNAIGQFTSIARYKAVAGGSSNEIATSDYSYNALGQLTGLSYKKGGSNLFTPYAWTYDNVTTLDALGRGLPLPKGTDSRVAALANGANFVGLGRITQVTSQDGTSSYTYDATSQLTGADHSYQTDETYTYDANGNRTMSGYSTGDDNQLLSDGTYDYEYDDEGNRTRKTNIADDSYTEYEWDYRNRLTKVTDKTSGGSTTQVVAYTYDVFNRRIGRALDTTSPFNLADAAIERYVLDDINGVTSLDGGNVVLDFVDPDGTGNQAIAESRRYLFGNAVDQILAQEDVTASINSATRVYWPLVDNLGTVRDLSKNDGTNATHFVYDSFGKVASGNAALSRYVFTSREWDSAVALQYNRLRWLDSTLGHWTSEDPIHFESRGTSLVSYVMNSPLNYSDPTGLVDFDPANVLAPGMQYRSPGGLFTPSPQSEQATIPFGLETSFTYGKTFPENPNYQPTKEVWGFANGFGCARYAMVVLGALDHYNLSPPYSSNTPAPMFPHVAPGVQLFTAPNDAIMYAQSLYQKGYYPGLFLFQTSQPLNAINQPTKANQNIIPTLTKMQQKLSQSYPSIISPTQINVSYINVSVLHYDPTSSVYYWQYMNGPNGSIVNTNGIPSGSWPYYSVGVVILNPNSQYPIPYLPWAPPNVKKPPIKLPANTNLGHPGAW